MFVVAAICIIPLVPEITAKAIVPAFFTNQFYFISFDKLLELDSRQKNFVYIFF